MDKKMLGITFIVWAVFFALLSWVLWGLGCGGEQQSTKEEIAPEISYYAIGNGYISVSVPTNEIYSDKVNRFWQMNIDSPPDPNFVPWIWGDSNIVSVEIFLKGGLCAQGKSFATCRL